ncbi:MAG: PTS sugar transporter subunit IIC [Fusobacteriia bacterium 4572_132]|nr:MAG: PTS sugar transporter subunit IIC [Fusobacteriia bacterium 4572_132]
MLNYINNKLITIEKDEILKPKLLEKLIDMVDKNSELLLDKDDFAKKIFDREEIGTTGIGRGIAVPHARCEKLNNIVLAIAILKKEIEFNTPDDEDVKIVLLVGAPKDKNKEYLNLLSNISKIFRNNEFREEMLKAENKEDVFELMASFFEES